LLPATFSVEQHDKLRLPWQPPREPLSVPGL